MTTYKTIAPFFLWFIFFICSNQILAQQKTPVKTDTISKVFFTDLAPIIENKYNVRLYFKNEWFEGKKFNPELANLPLEEFFKRIRILSKLTYISVNPTSYVLVPAETVINPLKRTNKEYQLVGDKADEGKYSQATLKGQVFDGKTGLPLIGAKVFFEKLELTAVTDKGGNFSVIVPVGEYQLKLNYAGYEDDSYPLKIIGNGRIDLELFEKSVQLNEVTITDKLMDANFGRSQMSMVRLNAKNIKELPVFMGERDIIKSMALLPGVQSTGEFGTGFFVRGGSSDQNLILVEDVPMFNSSHLFGLNSAINPDGVTSVTLLKAGIPAKYGERASSLLDIRLGSTSQKATAKGGIGLLNSRLNLELPMFKQRAHLLVGGRSSYSNWLFRQLPDVDLRKSSASFYDLNALLTVKISPKDKLILFGYYSDDKFGFNKSTYYHYDNLMASLRYTRNFSSSLSVGLLLGMSRYRYDLTESDTLKPKEAYKINSTTNYNNAKLNVNWLANNFHTINAGVNAILYRLQPGIYSPYGIESMEEVKAMQPEKALEMAAYISDNISITPVLNLELGIRYSDYSYLGPTGVLVNGEKLADTVFFKNNEIAKRYSKFEPRVLLRYNFNDISSVKISYNRINQFINLISNTMVMSPTDVYKLSSANLKPLTCNQFAVGYFRNFQKNTIETSVEVYYKTLKNVIEYRDGAQILLNENVEADLLNALGYNYGAEIFIKKNTGKLTGWASYTYSKSMRYTTSNVEGEQINQNRHFPSTFDKPHNVIIMGNYHISRRWRFSGTFTYNTGRPVTLPEHQFQFTNRKLISYSDRNKYRLAAYHKLDISITFDETLRLKQKWKGSWTLSIINVYGRKNPYSVFYKASSMIGSKFFQTYKLYQMSIISKPLPTLTYNFSF